MMDNFLALSNANADGMTFDQKKIDIRELCQDIVDEMKLDGKTTHTINSTYAGDCLQVYVDEHLIRSVVTNLLSNAVKYSPDGSEVLLQITCNSDQIVIRVQDSGIGIPEADMEHLFSPFHRAQNVGSIPGTGLGLSIIKQTIDAYGGDITVESQQDEGTTFTVTLPLVPVNRGGNQNSDDK